MNDLNPRYKIVTFILCVSLFSIAIFGCEAKFEAIEATYAGDTSEGVVLDENNKGFIVTGITIDGKKEKIDNWTIEKPATLEKDQTSAVEITYKGLRYEIEVECSTSERVRIEVEYDGDTKEGTVLSNSNEGIKVTGHYKNGTIKNETDWMIERPQTLKADEVATIVVKCGDFSSEILVKCNTSALEKISAEYVGDTKEGTTIRSGDDNVIVTAHYKNGSTERVRDWVVSDIITLRTGETSTLTIHYKDKETPLEIKCPSLSAEEYKAQCDSISYKELAQNPENYKGRHVTFTGKIVEIIEDFFKYAYRIKIVEGGVFTLDTIYVDYTLVDDRMPSFLEDDIVTFYGEYNGLMTYTTLFGDFTYPHVSAKYIDMTLRLE
ncbi:MAG TPA: hypothetical protein GX734_07250 [Clostridiaceae bacterium]|nr:hypothetical protein [Clostridiaceae bacterium]